MNPCGSVGTPLICRPSSVGIATTRWSRQLGTAVAQRECAVGDLGERRAVEGDSGVAQQPRHVAGDAVAQERQWRDLRADDRDVHGRVHVVRAVGGLQRELVQREWPERLRRCDEGDLLGVALLDVLDEAAQRDADRPVIDGDGAVECGRVRVPQAMTSASYRMRSRSLVRTRCAFGSTAASAPRTCLASKSATIATSATLRACAIENGSATAIGR